MIDACVNIDGRNCLLTMDGHATGSEVVCAGASAIVYALAGYLANTDCVHESDLESGKAKVSCVGDKGVQAAFRMAGIGLAQLAQQYPQYIKAVYIV